MRLALILVTGCYGATQVQQSALVPHATPIRGAGQPMGRDAEISIGGQTLVESKNPELADDTYSLSVPRTQVGGSVALRSRRIPDATFRVMYSHGLRRGAHSLANDPMPSGDVIGAGFGAAWSMKLSEQMRLSLGGELHDFRIPTLRDGSEGAEHVGVFGLGAISSYKLGGTNLYASLSMKTHPTVDRIGRSDDDDPVSTGEPMALWAVGIDQDLGDTGARVGLSVFSALTRRPVRYAPTVSAVVTVPLGAADSP